MARGLHAAADYSLNADNTDKILRVHQRYQREIDRGTQHEDVGAGQRSSDSDTIPLSADYYLALRQGPETCTPRVCCVLIPLYVGD